MVHIHLLKRRTGKRSNNYVTVQLKWCLKVKYLSIKAVFFFFIISLRLQIGLKCLDSILYLNKKVLSPFPSLKAVFFLNIFQDSLKTFHELVKLHFKGFLKPPFNTEGRRTAGMTEEVYLPLLNCCRIVLFFCFVVVVCLTA